MADRDRWYALAVKPQHEFRVFEGLQNLTVIEGFLPTYKDKRIWSDRVKVLDLPLFPGYVFARFEYPARRVPVLRVAGVRSIVGLGNSASSLPDEEINAVRVLVNSSFPVRPWPFLRAGNRVRVEHGPLRGVEGTVLEQKDEWRMVVSVELLQRSVSVLLDRSVLKSVSLAAGSS
ncbi:MAG TPA: transcription termination/antitermination NusG family protein [Bryobacteraceae bacterium]|jgi:transcription antitermination factor NusG|nr:transcription termination/antitermination NusG family protein [Bryobacteraceae bacterium]